MIYRAFNIVWDSSLSDTIYTLPSEAVISLSKTSDTDRMRLDAMDALDKEFDSVVESLDLEEI
jgi:hypothetical protein